MKPAFQIRALSGVFNGFAAAGVSACLMLLLGLCSPGLAWEGIVLAVNDGDTLTVAPQGIREGRITVRLYGVDAPELDQNHGPESASALAALVPVGSQVLVIDFGADRYGRLVGFVMAQGLCVNAAMLQDGHAWYYDRYCRAPVCREWKRLAAQARQAGIGLWAATATPPWEWRAAKPRRPSD